MSLYSERARNVFAEKAMKHGEDFEQSAKDAYLEISPDARLESNGDFSKIFGFLNLKENTPHFLMMTPDMIIKRGKQREIVEFKCPYFDVHVKKHRRNRIIKDIARDYLKNSPMGKELSFLQSAIYSLCEDTEMFNVVYYFTDGTEDKAMVIYSYSSVQDPHFHSTLYNSIVEVSTAIKQDGPLCKLKTSKTLKEQITRLVS